MGRLHGDMVRVGLQKIEIFFRRVTHTPEISLHADIAEVSLCSICSPSSGTPSGAKNGNFLAFGPRESYAKNLLIAAF